MSKAYNLVKENQDLFEYIKHNGHLDFVNLANECDAFARGEQWDPVVKAKLAQRRKPALTINKVLATCATLFGQQLERRGDITFRAVNGGDPVTGQMLDKLWINFVQTQDYDWIESAVFADGIIRSRGFLDLRISFDENMRGEPVVTYVNSKDVGLYPGDIGTDPDNWTGVLLSRWLSPRDIAEMYDKPLKEIMACADSSDMISDAVDWKKDSFGRPLYENYLESEEQRAKHQMLRVLERQEFEYKTVDCFVERETGEVREIPTTWDMERIQSAFQQYGYGVTRRRVKKINWVVSVGDVLLHSAISPFKHFTVVPYFPFYVGGQPVGIVEQLRDPQNLLNKTLSQELHIVAGIANSGYKVRTGSLTSMTPEQLQERGGEDGLVIEVNGNMADVEKLQPNQVPTGLDRLSYLAGEVMQQISLVNDSLQGLNRADESAKAVDRKATMGAGALSPVFASLDQTRKIVARNWLDLVQEFVTEPRVVYVTSSAKTASTEEVAVNQEQPDGSFLNDLTIGEYRVTVSNVQSRDSYDMAQFDVMMTMIRQGAPIPWSDIVNSLTVLENKDEIVQYLKSQEGRVEPSEEAKKKQQLDERMMIAQAMDKEASAAVKQAQAQKAAIGAQKDANAPDDTQMKMRMDQHKMALQQADAQNKMGMEQQKIALQQEVDAQKMQMEQLRYQLELEKVKLDLEAQRQKQAMEAQFMREKHEIELQKLRNGLQSDMIKASIDQQKRADVQESKTTQKAKNS